MGPDQFENPHWTRVLMFVVAASIIIFFIGALS